jgi:queuosine precursor transporter
MLKPPGTAARTPPRVRICMKQYRLLDLIIAVFVTVLVVSNIPSTAKIVDWGFRVFRVRCKYL